MRVVTGEQGARTVTDFASELGSTGTDGAFRPAVTRVQVQALGAGRWLSKSNEGEVPGGRALNVRRGA